MPQKAELNQEFGTNHRIDSTFQNHIAQGGCQEKEQSSFWYSLNSRKVFQVVFIFLYMESTEVSGGQMLTGQRGRMGLYKNKELIGKCK